MAVEHYEITAIDFVRESGKVFTTTENSHLLTELTEYTITLKACLDTTFADFVAADRSVSAATSEEYWQVQGNGNVYASATRIVRDGNGRSRNFSPDRKPELSRDVFEYVRQSDSTHASIHWNAHVGNPLMPTAIVRRIKI